MTAPELPEHWFRHEFGSLVAVLSRKLGAARMELCEDAAQTALLRATRTWARSGVPDDRGAWLYRVAFNAALDALRKERRVDHVDVEESVPPEDVFLASEVPDDLLRLLFVCADPVIPSESQLVLALKTLCGFSTEEIALRLFQSEEAIHKRLQRARARLRESLDLGTPPLDALGERRPRVLQTIYLLFNEGYSSAQPDCVIRRELCEEAVRLALILLDHPLGAAPEVFALLALMYFHAARFDARIDGAGGLLLLEDQDRSLWDGELVRLGFTALQASGTPRTRFHVEAAISAEHCIAPTYAATDWAQITRLYEVLERLEPSPIHALNRAIALAEWKGPDAGLAVLEALKPPGWLAGYYLWDAALGELYRRRGDRERARRHLASALASAPTNAEKDLLARRLASAS